MTRELGLSADQQGRIKPLLVDRPQKVEALFRISRSRADRPAKVQRSGWIRATRLKQRERQQKQKLEAMQERGASRPRRSGARRARPGPPQPQPQPLTRGKMPGAPAPLIIEGGLLWRSQDSSFVSRPWARSQFQAGWATDRARDRLCPGRCRARRSRRRAAPTERRP